MQSNNNLQSLRLPSIFMKGFMHLSNIYTNTDGFFFLKTVMMALALKALQKRFLLFCFTEFPIIQHLKTDRVQITSLEYIKGIISHWGFLHILNSLSWSPNMPAPCNFRLLDVKITLLLIKPQLLSGCINPVSQSIRSHPTYPASLIFLLK